MSHENRKRQYKMFMDRGEKEKAEDQIKGEHAGLLEEIKDKPSEEKEKPIKKKRGK